MIENFIVIVTVTIQSNLLKCPPLLDDLSSKMTNTESAQANSHTVVIV